MAPEIVATLEHAISIFERLGAHIRELKFPEMNPAAGVPMLAQIAVGHAETYPTKAEQYGPSLRELIEMGSQLPGAAVAAGVIARDHFRGEMARMFAEANFVLAPGLGRILPTWEALALSVKEGDGFDPLLTRFTLPFNAAGVPTISLPGGFTADGLPVGIQLAGPWLSEPALIRAAVAFQNETDFHTRHPLLD
jgi:amidase